MGWAEVMKVASPEGLWFQGLGSLVNHNHVPVSCRGSEGGGGVEWERDRDSDRQLILVGMWLVHSVKRLCACICGMTVPAIGLHQFVQMGKYSQTFSNEKARRVLKYTPILSTDEAFDRIVAEYKASLTS